MGGGVGVGDGSWEVEREIGLGYRFPVMTGVRHWTLTVMDTTDFSSFLY